MVAPGEDKPEPVDYDLPPVKKLKTDSDLTTEEKIDPENPRSQPGSRKNSAPIPEKKKKAFVFKQMKLKAKGLLFIRMDDGWASKASPFEVTHKILEDVHGNQKQLTKFAYRVYPIEYAFDAKWETFKHFMEILLEKHFPATTEGEEFTSNIGSTWNIQYKCRSNDKFSKDLFLSFFLEFLPNRYPQRLVHPDKLILIDISQHIMCVSVLDGKQKTRYSINPFAHEMHETRVAYKKVEKDRREEYNKKHGIDTNQFDQDNVSRESEGKKVVPEWAEDRNGNTAEIEILETKNLVEKAESSDGDIDLV